MCLRLGLHRVCCFAVPWALDVLLFHGWCCGSGWAIKWDNQVGRQSIGNWWDGKVGATTINGTLTLGNHMDPDGNWKLVGRKLGRLSV